MRLFIGIPLPREYQLMLESIKKKWSAAFKSKLSWTKPGNWHLTLKFLGNTPEERLPGLKKIITDLDFGSFFIQGSGAGFFGSKGVYRVIWLGLQNDVHSLISLAEMIDQKMADLGFEREKRPFKAHLTLARIKYFYRKDPWNELTDYISKQDWPDFEVNEVVLWQSILSRSGPEYKVICKTAA